MYSPYAVASTAAGVELVYVQRLKENLAELTGMKQQALDTEDYATANQLKEKMNILQGQLDRMEDQFTSDILQNCVTSWQTELSNLVQDSLSIPEKLAAMDVLDQKFHKNFVNIVKGIPLSYYDALIKAMLILLPHELPDAPKSPYGWEYFARKIQGSFKNQDTIDVVKATVTLLILDVLSIIVAGCSSHHVKKETFDLTLRHIFHYIHTVSIRRLNTQLEGPIFDKIFTRCGAAVGYIGALTYFTFANIRNSHDIFRYVLGFLDKKIPPEKVALSLSVLRFCFLQVQTREQAQETYEYLCDLQSAFEKSKKVVVRNAIIQTMERVIQPQQTSGDRTAEETKIWTEIIGIYKKARKWCTIDDLRDTSLSLLCIILVNSRIDFFAQNIDSYLNVDLCSKNKVRPYAYSCLLQLLRGRYYQDTLQNYEDSLNGSYVTGRHFASLTRPVNEQSAGTVANRLNAIAEMMFFRRKGVIPEEHRDTAAAIVIQICSHSIALGAKLISQLLDTTRVDCSPDCYYVGLRSLRVILDMESGFQKFAYSQQDPDFNLVIHDFPYDLTPSMSSIYAYTEEQIGVIVTGTSGKVLQLPAEFTSAGVGFAVTKPALELYNASTLLDQITNGSGLQSIENLSMEENYAPTSPLAQRISRLDFASPMTPNSLRRGSLLSSHSNLGSPNTMALSPSFKETLDEEDVEDEIGEVISKWFAAVGCPSKDISKYSHNSLLVDKARLKLRAATKLKAEQREALGLLQELILIIQFVPTPEFIGGNFFIGSFLTHSNEQLALDVAQTLITIFKDYPDLRLGYI